MPTETSQTGNSEKKRQKKRNKHNIQELCDNYKGCNKSLIVILERERGRE
jgi:hypothetical protein